MDTAYQISLTIGGIVIVCGAIYLCEKIVIVAKKAYEFIRDSVDLIKSYFELRRLRKEALLDTVDQMIKLHNLYGGFHDGNGKWGNEDGSTNKEIADIWEVYHKLVTNYRELKRNLK